MSEQIQHAWIGWQALITGTFLAFILASAYGIALLVTHRASRGSQLPLGPLCWARVSVRFQRRSQRVPQ
jgi:leader peptidase (prepilin peptidase)/N-methyltransferase